LLQPVSWLSIRQIGSRPKCLRYVLTNRVSYQAPICNSGRRAVGCSQLHILYMHASSYSGVSDRCAHAMTGSACSDFLSHHCIICYLACVIMQAHLASSGVDVYTAISGRPSITVFALLLSFSIFYWSKGCGPPPFCKFACVPGRYYLESCMSCKLPVDIENVDPHVFLIPHCMVAVLHTVVHTACANVSAAACSAKPMPGHSSSYIVLCVVLG